MKILMINKFLYPNGGAETYMFGLGEALQKAGHEVQYFGMEHKKRCVGNRVNSYTATMDFHNGSVLGKITYPIRTIYSVEAGRKIRKVLDDFKPDVCHINNFNYQLTPSIILEIVNWRKKTGKQCKIIYTAHDYQLICPDHMLYNPDTRTLCEKCKDDGFFQCAKNRCIHGSLAKSTVGYMEAQYWKIKKIYNYFDKIICPSLFIKNMLDENRIFKNKTVVIHNFINHPLTAESDKNFLTKKPDIPENYVLYFGRYSKEKGIETLLKACRNLSGIPFVFAGSGEMKTRIESLENVHQIGFCKGCELEYIISHAKFCIVPSEWYEVFGLSIAEAIGLGTPVIAAGIGGIPEIVKSGITGELFSAGSAEQLTSLIGTLWDDPDRLEKLRINCKKEKKFYVEDYYNEIIKLYESDRVGTGKSEAKKIKRNGDSHLSV